MSRKLKDGIKKILSLFYSKVLKKIQQLQCMSLKAMMMKMMTIIITTTTVSITGLLSSSEFPLVLSYYWSFFSRLLLIVLSLLLTNKLLRQYAWINRILNTIKLNYITLSYIMNRKNSFSRRPRHRRSGVSDRLATQLLITLHLLR